MNMHIPEGLLSTQPGSGGSLKAVSVKFSEVGTECWSPARFVGAECTNLKGCKASCKKTCKAYLDKTIVTKTRVRVLASSSTGG